MKKKRGKREGKKREMGKRRKGVINVDGREKWERK